MRGRTSRSCFSSHSCFSSRSWYKLGTKVNQCAKVSSVNLIIFDFLVAPANFGQNDDEGSSCLGAESSKSEITSMIKQHIGMMKIFFSENNEVAIM